MREMYGKGGAGGSIAAPGGALSKMRNLRNTGDYGRRRFWLR